jgi:hypothetical protein
VFTLQDDPASDRGICFLIPVLAMHDHGQSVRHGRIDRVGRLSEVEAPRSLRQVTAFQGLRPTGSQKCTLSLGIDPWVIPAQVGKLASQLIISGFVLVETGRVPHRPLMQRRQPIGVTKQLSLMSDQCTLHRGDRWYFSCIAVQSVEADRCSE